MKTKLFFYLFFSVSLSMISQNKIDEVKLSNGQTIIVFDNNTWSYKDGNKTSTIQEKKDIEKTSQRANITTNRVSQTKGETSTRNTRSSTNRTKTSSSICGARTKKGGYCQRRVAGGGRCWQH